jgi:hypothetical protein
VHVLNGLLALEYRAIAAYTASTPRLPQPPTPPTTVAQQPSQQPAHSDPPPPALELTLPLASAAAAHFLSQELAHVTELKGFIKQVGVHPVRPEPSYDLGHPRTKQDVLSLLRRIEEAQVAAYLDAVTALSPGKLRSAIAAILANHAQQLSVWRTELGLPPLPSAFVTGRE